MNELQELNSQQIENLFRIIEDSDLRSLRSIPIHLYNLNFLWDKSKVAFDKKLSPLLVACFIGKVEIIQILTSNIYLDVNLASEEESYTPIMVALYKGYYEVTKFLLDNNANINIPTKSGHYPLLFCFSRLEDDKYKYENRTLCMIMIDLLLKKGADINIKVDSNPGNSIIMKLASAEIDDEESLQSTLCIIKFMLQRGASKTITTYNGHTIYDLITKSKYQMQFLEILSTEQIYFYENNNKLSSCANLNTISSGGECVIMEKSKVNEKCFGCSIF